MKIIIDAMGGDNAPDQIVLGALQSAKEFGIEIVLVGRGEQVLSCMKAHGWDTLPAGVEVANADAFISAGSSGALLTAATLIVKRIRGIRRAAFAPLLPIGGGTILVDAGANIECTPEYLLQFGCMGSLFARKAHHKPNPRVALLNNGAEETKGDELHREAYQLLKKAGENGTINFIGNIEARDVPDGGADVVVADGFSGNVLLKSVEGTAIYMSKLMKAMFTRSAVSKLGYLCCKKGVNHIKELMDYREVGGSMVIGIGKPVIKAHGSSDARAVRGAIKQAIGAVESGFCDDIRANVAAMTLPREGTSHAEEARTGPRLYLPRPEAPRDGAVAHVLRQRDL